jgi:hypothetical protein
MGITGCIQHTPPTITNNGKERTSVCRFFLTNFKQRDVETLVHHANHYPIEKSKPSRGVHHFLSPIHQNITPKYNYTREKHHNAQE